MDEVSEGAAASETVDSSESADSEVSQPADDWAGAEEAFEEADEEAEPSETESHLEQSDTEKKADGVDPEFEKLRIPQKYKKTVQEYISKLGKSKEGEVSVEQYREANESLLGVLKDIAGNPQKIADYVLDYGDKLGLDNNLIESYRGLKNKQPMAETKTTEEKKADKVAEIMQKHGKKLLGADNPETFLASLQDIITDTYNASQTNAVEMVKMALSGYHNKLIEPNLKEIDGFKQTKHYETTRQLWNSAREKVKSSNQDFEKYEPKILETIASDPIFKSHVERLNKDYKSSYNEGLTHEKIVKMAYDYVTRNDHIENAKKKSEWNGGLKPSGKNIKTSKASYDDWDDIGKELYPEAF